MKAPRKVDRAFCERSSDTSSEKERGVARALAAAKADTIEVTARVAITSMLPAVIDSSVSIESDDTARTRSPKGG